MSRLVTLIRLDAKLAARHKLVHVTVILAGLFGLLVAFVIPSELAPAVELAVEPGTAAVAPTVLEPGAEKPPLNQLFIPILLALDLSLLGFMFGAVMLLQDKQHGTIRMFRVGPGTSLDYIGSKLAVNLGLSLLSMLILVGIGAPWALLEPRLPLLVLSICAGMTLLGMGLAVFFRGLTQFFFPLAAAGLLAAMPMYLMFTPTSALAWTRWLPTYHVLFGAEALMFTHDAQVITTALAYSGVFVLLTALFCGAAVQLRLVREVH